MSDFNIQFEEQDQSITLEFEQIGGGAVKSVNGKTGAVVLDAGDLEYDDTETYSSGSVGDELSTLKDGLSDLETQITATLITDTASGAIASFPDGADRVPVKSLTVAIEPVQSGSGDPSPTNIRPISGHTQAKVTRTRANVWDEVWELGTISDSNGANISGSSNIRSKNYIPVVHDQTYYFKCPNNITLRFYDVNKSYIGAYDKNNAGDGNSMTRTMPSNCYFLRFTCYQAYGTTYNHDISINYPSTDHDYHSGQVAQYEIDLDGTRYGGTLDVVTGVMTVDRAMVDLGSLTWTYYTSGTYPILYAEPSGHRAYVNGEHTDAICENYSEGNPVAARSTLASGNLPDKTFSWISGATGSFTVRDSSYTSASDFKTAMNGVKLIYPLATPFTVQLSANDITTLLGQNNVWNDCGDTTVEYRADTKLYIQKVINS